MSDWNSLDSDSTFRIVLSNFEKESPESSAIVRDLISWRDHQRLPKPRLRVVKFGRPDFFEANDFSETAELLREDPFRGGPARVSAYQRCESPIDEPKLAEYDRLAAEFKPLGIRLCVAWIIDLANDESAANSAIRSAAKFRNVSHVAMLNSVNAIDLSADGGRAAQTLIELRDSGMFLGYDVVGNPNSLFGRTEGDNFNLLEFSQTLRKIDEGLAHAVVPEFSSIENDDEPSDFLSSIDEFSQNGFSVDMSDMSVSPLAYGSADDFPLPAKLALDDMACMTYGEVRDHFRSACLKAFSKSFCFSCDRLQDCQKRKIYLLNLSVKDRCSIFRI